MPHKSRYTSVRVERVLVIAGKVKRTTRGAMTALRYYIPFDVANTLGRAFPEKFEQPVLKSYPNHEEWKKHYNAWHKWRHEMMRRCSDRVNRRLKHRVEAFFNPGTYSGKMK